MSEWPRKSNESKRLFQEAASYLPEGVSANPFSPKNWDPYPIFIKKGRGSEVCDADGNWYIDTVLGAGSLILGHTPHEVVKAVIEQLSNGTIFWAPTRLMVEVAKQIAGIVPSIQKLRFCNSGTEAVLHATRIARAYSNRKKILKFEGQYHGWQDSAAVSTSPPLSLAGLKHSPRAVPDSAGMLKEVLNTVVVAPWNDFDAVERIVKKHQHDLAAVITAPMPVSMGSIPPLEGFLNALRELTEEYDILLIFDEIVNGFRLSLGGGQEMFNVTPDLCTLGKALGGGFPVAVVGGRSDIMDIVGEGKVKYMGTFNANPLCLSACKATLQELESGALIYLHKNGRKLMQGMEDLIEDRSIQAIIQGHYSEFTIFFTELQSIKNYRESLQVNRTKHDEFHRCLLKEGVFSHRSSNVYLSSAHKPKDIETILGAVDSGLAEM